MKREKRRVVMYGWMENEGKGVSLARFTRSCLDFSVDEEEGGAWRDSDTRYTPRESNRWTSSSI